MSTSDDRDNNSTITSGRTNKILVRLLSSRLHWLASRWLCVIRYAGRKSGRLLATPTQFVQDQDRIIILVGRHRTKTWWRNFVVDPHHIDVCVRGSWVHGTGIAIQCFRDPETARELFTLFEARYPNAPRAIDGSSAEEKIQNACFVSITPT